MRTRHPLPALLLLILSVGAAAPALEAGPERVPEPQTRPPASPMKAPAKPRFLVSVNGAFQPATGKFEDRFSFPLHQETGASEVAYQAAGAPGLDASVSIAVWRNLAAAAALSRVAADATARASASVPHPFFLDSPREVAGEARGMRREETGIHLQMQYMIPMPGKLQLTLMAGPSVLNVTQMIVTRVNYSDEYPYDAATFAGVSSRKAGATAFGFNGGIDLRWMFSRSFGAGAALRFTRGATDLDAGQGRTVAVDAGGPQVGAGLRVAF